MVFECHHNDPGPADPDLLQSTLMPALESVAMSPTERCTLLSGRRLLSKQFTRENRVLKLRVTEDKPKDARLSAA